MWRRYGALLREENKESGDGGGSDFNLAAVTKLIDDKVNAAVNGAAKRLEGAQSKAFGDLTKQVGELAEIVKSVTKAGDEGDKGGDKGEKKGGDPAINAELEKLRKGQELAARTIEELKAENAKAKQAAEAKEQELEVSRAFSDVQFANAASKDLALAHVAGKVKRDDSGNLVVAGDAGDVPVAHYVKTYLEGVPNLLAPKAAGGAGSGKGTVAGGGIDLDQLVPGKMTEDQKKAANARIAQLMKQ